MQKIYNNIAEIRSARRGLGRIAFVPTMGNLHDGHITLMRAAAKHADHVIASLFVNRIQFGPKEDFERYPRTLEADCERLAEAGVEHVFAPNESVMYPHPQTYFVLPSAANNDMLEGAVRAGHFRGVATVVMKLLNIVQPDVAFFGKKDYQQLMVLTNMVREFNMPIEIVAGETVRAHDGLALSSRNGFLSEAERAEAPRMHALLKGIATALRLGANDYNALEEQATATLNAHGWQTDYIAIRQRADLQEPLLAAMPLVVLGAAKLGKTRLIDNIEI